jgi:hypothetical protein
MSRSRLRAAALDHNDSFSFANVTVDGYSGEELNEGYQTGIVLKWGPTGATQLTLASADGAITQDGIGLVTFNGQVRANNDVEILGDLTVLGTTTEIDSQKMTVTDPITTLNSSGTELLSDWAGLTLHDADGYNRIGWNFDGYWAVSSAFTPGSDANPDRALAFLGTGVTNGDLSSTTSNNSGADHIGNTAVGNLISTNVQDALEELQGDIDDIYAGNWDLKGTTSLTFMINRDATGIVDEDACLILKGGDGTDIIDGYLCTITDSVNGDRMQFSMYQAGSLISPDVHIGTLGLTDDLDALLTFNAGDGASAHQAVIELLGTEDSLHYTADHHTFSGPVRLTGNEVVDGYLYAYGNVVLGNSLGVDTLDINATITSDLVPTDETYYVGTPTNKWIDGYFDFFVPANYTPVGDNYSLEGHLKGIDAALASITSAPHGVYIVTTAEGTTNSVDSARAVDQGDQTDLTSYSDVQFRDDILIYLDGQLLMNDTAKRANTGAVVNDVARDTADPSVLLFSRNIKKGSVLQIVVNC